MVERYRAARLFKALGRAHNRDAGLRIANLTSDPRQRTLESLSEHRLRSPRAEIDIAT